MAKAQVVIPNLNFAVTQNFSTDSVPTGWAFSEAGTNADGTVATGSGGSNSGNTYFLGTTGDYAFGGLRSGSLIPTFGAEFRNNTGLTITRLNISYTGETWRVGSANRSDSLTFQYSLDATSLTTGTWVSVSALNYVNPGQATGSGSLQHSANLSSSITSLSIAAGSTFWIRWNDTDATSSDDAMGVDNFSLTAVPEPTTGILLLGATGALALLCRRRQA